MCPQHSAGVGILANEEPRHCWAVTTWQEFIKSSVSLGCHIKQLCACSEGALSCFMTTRSRIIGANGT